MPGGGAKLICPPRVMFGMPSRENSLARERVPDTAMSDCASTACGSQPWVGGFREMTPGVSCMR